jgi:DNA polymerase (family 10)
VRIEQLRGELHAHSDWSDGRGSVLEMARAARERGDSYYCVTDHSAPYALVNGLDAERIAAQAAAIAQANEQLRRDHEVDGEPPFVLLQGSEVEILADGSLGLADATLATLDWVVASIHMQQGQDAATIGARMERVIANPLVDAIGHPTSRRLLRRERTQLDVMRLIELCAGAGVVLEINGNPDRLDLDSAQARLALAAGVTLMVNTDAHGVEHLALREHGVAVARRAGARASDVVNCLTPAALAERRRRERS